MRTIPIPSVQAAATQPVPVNGTPATSTVRLVEASTSSYQEPLIVAVYGDAGVGKSRLLGTAPGAVGLVPMEHKARQSVLRAAEEFGQRVIMPEVDLVRSGNPMLTAILPPCCVHPDLPEFRNVDKSKLGPYIQERMQEIADKIKLDSERPTCCKRHYYRWHVNRVKSVAFRMLEHSAIRTIGIDTCSAFVDDTSFANYGIAQGLLDPKEYGFAPRQDINNELREFFNAMSVKNMVLTFQSTGVWRNGQPTGKTKPMCNWGKLDHFVSVQVEMTRDDDAIKSGRTPVYRMTVKDCQANASLIGQEILTDDEITFGNLAMRVYPDSRPETWE